MSRRLKGEGCIRYRKDKDCYEARFYVVENGEKKQKFISRKDKDELIKVVAKVKASIVNGTYVSNNKITVGEWADKWLWEIKKCEIRSSTFQSYDDKIRNHIKKHLAPIKLQELRIDDIQVMVNSMNEDKKSYRTIEYTYKLVKSMLQEAVIRELVFKNVAIGVKLPQKPTKETRVLTSTEQAKFIEECKKSNMGLFLLFLLYTGFRVGEVLGLRWENVDMINNVIHIRETLKRVKINYEDNDKPKTAMITGEPKSKKSKRNFPISPIVKLLLEKQKKVQMVDKLKAGSLYDTSSGYVFTNEFGTNVDPNTPTRALNKICKNLGIKIKIHSLRHSFATRGFENGVTLKEMQELLGHSVLSVTSDVYTHVMGNVLTESIDTFTANMEQNGLGVKAISGGW